MLNFVTITLAAQAYSWDQVCGKLEEVYYRSRERALMR